MTNDDYNTITNLFIFDFMEEAIGGDRSIAFA